MTSKRRPQLRRDILHREYVMRRARLFNDLVVYEFLVALRLIHQICGGRVLRANPRCDGRADQAAAWASLSKCVKRVSPRDLLVEKWLLPRACSFGYNTGHADSVGHAGIRGTK